MKKRSRFLQVPIEPFTVDPEVKADELLEKMERISFQGRSLGVAHRVWQKMLGDDVTIFMGMAGAPYPYYIGYIEPAAAFVGRRVFHVERHVDRSRRNGDLVDLLRRHVAGGDRAVASGFGDAVAGRDGGDFG